MLQICQLYDLQQLHHIRFITAIVGMNMKLINMISQHQNLNY